MGEHIHLPPRKQRHRRVVGMCGYASDGRPAVRMEGMAPRMAVETRGRRTADRIAPHGNNFTLLRVVAASVVIWDHAYRLVGSTPPLTAAIGFADAGTLAVYTFFAVSGYLLLGSWAASPRPGQFALKRVLRIMPALVVAVLGTALLVGPLFTTLPLGDYLSAPQTRDYVLRNVVLYKSEYLLPGVFTHQPVPAVNGSIWTLCYEVTLYTLIPLLGLLLLRRHRGLGALAVLGVAALPWDQVPPAVPGLEGLNIGILATFARYFLMGALLFAYRDRVPLRWPVAVGVGLALVLSLGHWWGAWVSYAALPYLVVYLARLDLAPLRGRFRRRDVSYGLYVWAFPVEQGIVSVAGGRIDPLTLCAVALPVTGLLAIVSWHFVEAPAMRAKGLIITRLGPRGGRRAVGSAPVPWRALLLASAGGLLAGVVSAPFISDHVGHPVAALAAPSTASTIARPAVVHSAREIVPPAGPAPRPAARPGPPQPKPILIYLHGLNERPDKPALPELLAAARADGYQVIFTDEGGPQTWGNKAAVDAVAALKAKYSPNRPVRLLGVSMGTCTLVNYAATAPPGSIASAVGILPITHLPTVPGDVITEQWAHASDAAPLVDIPYQMWYGTADTYAGYPTTHGPHVSAVAMAGAKHAVPIPWDLKAIFHYLDTDGKPGA
jgi:peptidoglycan/LPS O-acetylase OafA/YrhL